MQHIFLLTFELTKPAHLECTRYAICVTNRSRLQKYDISLKAMKNTSWLH